MAANETYPVEPFVLQDPEAAQKLPLFLKRLLDVVIAFCGLIILSPVLVLVGLAIQLDSPGQALFRQARVGRGGARFQIWKFRTMHSSSALILEEYLRGDPSQRLTFDQYQKLWNDPRLTRLGKLLRHFSLDELPQLVNVLRGEMSLVGPRPILPEQIPLYGAAYSQYIRRLPGITGAWQIFGRNHVSFSDRVHLDEWYFKHWSFGLDLWILSRTLEAALQGDGAY